MHGVVWFARFTGKLFHFHYYRRLCIPFGLRLMFVNQTAPSPCVTDTLWTEEGISWGVVASPWPVLRHALLCLVGHAFVLPFSAS